MIYIIYQVYFTICYRNWKPLILFRNESEWNLELLWCVKSQKCIFLMLFLTLGKRSVTRPCSQNLQLDPPDMQPALYISRKWINSTTKQIIRKLWFRTCCTSLELDCIWVYELPVLIVNKQRSKKNTSVHETEFWERDTEEVQIHDFNCN